MKGLSDETGEEWIVKNCVSNQGRSFYIIYIGTLFIFGSRL